MGLPLERLPDWPAAMDWETALAFTGVGEAQLRAWQRKGKVRFVPRGPRGAMLALRSDLETALAEMFGDSASEDMSFDGD